MVELSLMKSIAKTLPLIFFLLLILLITIIISGVWVRTQKIISNNNPIARVVENTRQIFSGHEEVAGLTPTNGFVTTQGKLDFKYTSTAKDRIIVLSGPNLAPITLAQTSDNLVSSALDLQPGVNFFKLQFLTTTDFSVAEEVPFVYYLSEESLDKEAVGVYGRVVSTLGGNIEVKSLISDTRYTFSTTDQTPFVFVNPREENDGQINESLKNIDKIEVDDKVFGIGKIVGSSVQNTQNLISYSNKDPYDKTPKPVIAEIAAVDTKREYLTVNNDKTKYYWDKTTKSAEGLPLPKDLKKGQKILFYASSNSYGNLIVRQILAVI